MNKYQGALDKACEYIHSNGFNGCPKKRYDVDLIDKEKECECILCKFDCFPTTNDFYNKEYEKKSKECWEEYFLKGEIDG